MPNIHKIIVFLHQIPSWCGYILTIGMSQHPKGIIGISETMVKHHWDGHPNSEKQFDVPDHWDDLQDVAL